MSQLIPISRGLETIVDDLDYRWLSQWNWTANDKHYVHRRDYSQKPPKHRLIMRPLAGQFIDHIDGDPLNNRRSNLRFCTNRQNMANMRRKQHGLSQYKGVVCRHGRWRAQIGVNSKKIYLGVFDSEMDAAKAYDQAARYHFGEFACLNNA